MPSPHDANIDVASDASATAVRGTDDAQRLRTLETLCTAYGPPGEEGDVAAVCESMLRDYCDDVRRDEVGNVIATLKGSSDNEGRSMLLLAHLDEIALIVKRITPDGKLRVEPLGGIYPGDVGLGPVEILGRRQRMTAVLSGGSVHVTEESGASWDARPFGGGHSMDWRHVFVFTGRTRAQLEAAGVHPGCRVVLHRDRRHLIDLGDYWGGRFFDDRAPLVVMLSLVRDLAEQGRRPFFDVHFVCTTQEEVGAHGAVFAARHLPATVTLGLEVAPAEFEYGIELDHRPVVVFRDEEALYDRAIANTLIDVAEELGMHCQAASLSTYKSDVSHAKSAGLAIFSGLLCLPTLNTHGFEIVHKAALDNMQRVLAEFITRDDLPILFRYPNRTAGSAGEA